MTQEFSNREHMATWTPRPKHEYVRIERFRATLYHLTGMAGKAPEDIVELVERELKDFDPESMWVSIQKILSTHRAGRVSW